MNTGEIVALAGLAVVVVGHIALTAFHLGKLSQRVASLEKESEGMAGVSEKVTRLEVQMDTALAGKQKVIGSGTSVPDNSVGANGDFYAVYTA